ncbi:MAG: hypothetical protein V1495_02040 [Pseudomonadota bacterium]
MKNVLALWVVGLILAPGSLLAQNETFSCQLNHPEKVNVKEARALAAGYLLAEFDAQAKVEKDPLNQLDLDSIRNDLKSGQGDWPDAEEDDGQELFDQVMEITTVLADYPDTVVDMNKVPDDFHDHDYCVPLSFLKALLTDRMKMATTERDLARLQQEVENTGILIGSRTWREVCTFEDQDQGCMIYTAGRERLKDAVQPMFDRFPFETFN